MNGNHGVPHPCMPCEECCFHAQVFMTPDYLAIAMEFAAGGDMFEYVVRNNGLREEEARWFFQQLIVGMDYCHNMVSAGTQFLLPAPPQTPMLEHTSLNPGCLLCRLPWLLIHVVSGGGESRHQVGEYAAGCIAKAAPEDL